MHEAALAPQAALVDEFDAFLEVSRPGEERKEKWPFSAPHATTRTIRPRSLSKLPAPRAGLLPDLSARSPRTPGLPWQAVAVWGFCPAPQHTRGCTPMTRTLAVDVHGHSGGVQRPVCSRGPGRPGGALPRHRPSASLMRCARVQAHVLHGPHSPRRRQNHGPSAGPSAPLPATPQHAGLHSAGGQQCPGSGPVGPVQRRPGDRAQRCFSVSSTSERPVEQPMGSVHVPEALTDTC